MAVLTRGNLGDRPWGQTLFVVASRGLTGEVVVVADGRRYVIAFAEGAVVAASSPIASDSAVRLASTAGLVAPSQLGELGRRLAQPVADEIAVIAEVAALPAELALRLRRRVTAHKAIRTFQLGHGELTISDEVTLPWDPAGAIDVRAILLLGARTHMTEGALASAVREFGPSVRLRAGIDHDLPQYGFIDDDQALLAALSSRVAIPPPAGLHPDPRAAYAVLYALATTGALEAAPGDVVAAPAARASRPGTGGTVAPPVASAAGAVARVATPRRRRAGDSADAARDAGVVRALVDERLALLRRGVDHFELLGVAPGASDADLRAAYFRVARKLHPDRLSAIGFVDDDRAAHQLFARLNEAFATLTVPSRRLQYEQTLAAGGEVAQRAKQVEAEELTRRILAAEEHYQRALAALRGDQPSAALSELATALELNSEPEYAVVMAWAQYLVAPDRAAAARGARAVLEEAIASLPRLASAHFYLGRIARLSGNDAEALQRLRTAAALSPHDAEIATELRAAEARQPKR